MLNNFNSLNGNEVSTLAFVQTCEPSAIAQYEAIENTLAECEHGDKNLPYLVCAHCGAYCTSEHEALGNFIDSLPLVCPKCGSKELFWRKNRP